MIRIKELFRLQNLHNLRLIAGQEGIGRTVTAAVLLEYDATRMQLPDFYRGDLVVTTLAYARGDNQLVANSLLALMNQGIAGLLVKTAYFTELPASVVNMANKLVKYELLPPIQLPGVHVQGAGGFMEFHPDRDALISCVIDTFCEPLP